MLADELFSKRLVVLSGKGGVGKSTVAAALALLASGRGLRVLLVEIDAPLGAGGLFGAAPGRAREREVGPGLFAVNLRPSEVMDEYVRHAVRLEVLSRRVLTSPVYSRFFAAAPGLRELMVLGKIMVLEEERENWSRKPRYDLILVDAPATGHGLSLLKVPLAASQAIPVGPVGGQARRILRLLRDEEKTALLIVALPEEMAVVEALEFQRMVDEMGISPHAIVLNGYRGRLFSAAEEAEVLRLAARRPGGRLARGVPLADALAAGRRRIRRGKLSRFYLERLRRSAGLPVVALPFLYREEIGLDDLRELGARFETP